MFSFAPPVKVARTQRLDGPAHGSFEDSANRSAMAALAGPSSLEDAVITSGDVTLTPSLFLSGAGEHMAWLVDENHKLLRLWNLANPAWRRTQPRMAPIPNFGGADEEGLPLFVSEMGESEESLAFCSDKGVVSSLDHSVEFRVLDGDAAISASCFACLRRIDCGDVLLTAIGTNTGSLVVDVKENGERVTLKFDRTAFGGRPLPVSQSDAPRSNRASRASTGGGSSRLWSSVRSFLSGGSGGRGHGEAEEEDRQQGVSASDGEEPANGLAFTHITFRRNYPREMVAVNAASELALLEMNGGSITPRWINNVQAALGRAGYVVAVAETRHKINVLFLTTPALAGSSDGRPALPSLLLATFSSSQGSLIHYVPMNAVADVVKAVAEVPRHHVRLCVHDSHAHALVFVRHYCLRVNIQVGVRSPCLSADTSIVTGVPGPLCSTLRPDGSAVTLGTDGPVTTWENLWDSQPPPVLKLESEADTGSFLGSASPDRLVDVDRRIAAMLKAVQADGGRLTLDAAVLQASEDIFTQRRAHHGNWARADLNAEDENIVLYVTKDLRRRQQLHRRFLLAVLQHDHIASHLQPETIAQVISAQEALLCQVALRGLQNVGVVGPASPASTLTKVARPFLLHDIMGGGDGDVKLLQTVEQVERCQQMLRRAIIQVAKGIREHAAALAQHNKSATGGTSATDGEEGWDTVASATAVELAFSNPAYAVDLLKQVGEIMVSASRSAVMDSDEKFACSHAAACMFVIVAQTIVESREGLRECYTMPENVFQHLWTATEDASVGVQLAFAHVCTSTSSALVDAVVIPALQQHQPQESAGRNEEGLSRGSSVRKAMPLSSSFVSRVVSTTSHLELLDLVGYLLHFTLSATGIAATSPSTVATSGAMAVSPQGGDPAVSALLTQTLLREPLVAGPFGYPFGAPVASSHSSEVSRRALHMAEALALQFDAAEVLLAFSLSTPHEDPQPAHYAKLQAYCQRNPHMLTFALEALWQQRREWELLCLPTVLPTYAPTTAALHDFLERRAPHLLWLAAPGRYDALAMEGTAAPPYIPYGPTQLSHRSRCLSVGKLAWVASGAQASAKYDGLELDASLVAAQGTYLSPQCDDMVLGLQDVVQRLLALEGNVDAWVAAATVAARANARLAEDLLVQVVRRCKEYDGDAVLQLYADSVSEREVMASMLHTAVGAVVSTCTSLQDQATLERICETVLTSEEFQIVSAWLAALWTQGQR